MPRVLALAACLALLPTSGAACAQPQLSRVAERLKAPGEPSLGYPTLEVELSVLRRDCRPLEAYLKPPRDTTRENVDKVYGSKPRFQKGGKGPDYYIYTLGDSGMELWVFYKGDKVDFTVLEERLPKGILRLENSTYVPTTAETVAWYRWKLPRLRAAVDEYDEKLADASWNWR